MEKPIEIGPLLDGIIKETGLTQEEIAAELDYDAVYLSQARKAGTKKLYNRLVAFINDYRKSKLSNKEYPIENQEIKDELILQLKKNNEYLERSLEEMKGRLKAVDKAFEEIQVMKGYMNRFEENQKRIAANLKAIADDQFLFGAIQQCWQEYWAENLPLQNPVEPRVIKETIRKKAASLLMISEEKGKTVFFDPSN